MVKETVEELLKEHMIKTIENKRKANKTVLDLFVKYLKSSTKSMEDARKKLKKKYPKFF